MLNNEELDALRHLLPRPFVAVAAKNSLVKQFAAT